MRFVRSSLVGLASSLAIVGAAWAAPPVKVKDVPFPAGVNRFDDAAPGLDRGKPVYASIGNGRIVFAARDALHGEELWVTDGTEAGTRLVRDICPGPCGTNLSTLTAGRPAHMVSMGTFAVFEADDGFNGTQLWRTDGTPAGTSMIKNFGGPASGLRGLLRAGSHAYVFRDASLWRTDGTPAGTTEVTPTAARDLLEVGGVVYFVAASGSLVRTDGTPAGTTTLKTGINAFNLVALGNTLYFRDSASNAIWKSDGTPAGTVSTHSFAGSGGPLLELVSTGSMLFAGVFNAGSGGQLWKSDGTSAGTTFLKTISTAGAPLLVASGGKVFAAGFDPTNGTEVWVSDGSVAGTRMIVDLNPGAAPGIFSNILVPYLDGVVYPGISTATGIEPYFTNGAAPVLLHDINPNNASSIGSNFMVDGNTVYFAAQSSVDQTFGAQLWKSTAPGAATTTRVARINPYTQPSFGAMIPFANKLFFTANQPLIATDLWSSDGTEPGTTMVTSKTGQSLAELRGLAVANNTLFFTTANALWRTDGTAAGTVSAANLNQARPLVGIGNVLFTIAGGGSSNTAYAYTQANGAVSLGLANGPNATMSGIPFGNNAIVHMSNGLSYGVYVTDGTAGNTTELAALGDGPVMMGGSVYFARYSASPALMKTDGTPGGTTVVKAMTGGPIPPLVVVGGTMYFRASGGTDGEELWKSDGTDMGTVMVKDIFAGPQSGGPRRITAFGTKVIFTARDATGGHWFISDGTDQGTVKLTDAPPGACAPLAVGNVLYFCAGDEYGSELWVSDGTPANTYRWVDLNPGAVSSNPDKLTLFGGKLYFGAYIGNTLSLFSADVSGGLPAPIPPAVPVPGTDAGTNPDPGSSSSSSSTGGVTPGDPSASEDSGGCGCRTVPDGSGPAGALAAAIAAAVLAIRRKRSTPS